MYGVKGGRVKEGSYKDVEFHIGEQYVQIVIWNKMLCLDDNYVRCKSTSFK